MVKHTQKIGKQVPDELFECVWPFCGVAVLIIFYLTSGVPIRLNLFILLFIFHVVFCRNLDLQICTHYILNHLKLSEMLKLFQHEDR